MITVLLNWFKFKYHIGTFTLVEKYRNPTYHVLILQLQPNFIIFRVSLTQRQTHELKLYFFPCYHHQAQSRVSIQVFHQRLSSKSLIYTLSTCLLREMWIESILKTLQITSPQHFYSLPNSKENSCTFYVHESYLKRKGGHSTSGHDTNRDGIYSPL